MNATRDAAAGWLGPITAPKARLRDLFCDLAIQHGIKCGLAAILAWWVAQVIRLPNPTWALITVFVLALAPYVGSMGEKGLLRIIGTLIGGILGMLLVGNFADNMLIILGGLALILTVSTWLFGWNRFPYAFFLCALTTLVVVSAGMSNPDRSWSIALHRFLEVSIGVGATLLVNSLIWPRYAQIEFKNKLAASMEELRTLFADAVGESKAEPGVIQHIESTLIMTLTAMRQLLHFGSAESLPFRRRVPVYMKLIPEIAMLFFCVFALRRTGGSAKLEHPESRQSLQQIEQELLRALDLLIAGNYRDLTAEMHQITTMLEDTKRRTGEIVAENASATKDWNPTLEMVSVSALLVTLEDLHHHLFRIAELFEALENPPAGDAALLASEWTPRLRQYWLRSAIKGALAACIAIVLCDWLNPPGGSMIPLAAWVTVVFSRGYVLGEGDRRCFQYVAATALVMLAFCGWLLLATPMMASYAVTNTFLFLSLFVFGYSAIKIGGVTFWLQVYMLAVCSAFGLNAQMPVQFQSIVGVFFGIVLGALIGATIQRLVWPVLPPHELKYALIEFLSSCREFPLQTNPAKIQALRVIITTAPVEMNAWVKRLETADVPDGEQARWTEFIDSLRESASSLRALMRLLQDPVMVQLAAKMDGSLHRELESLRQEFDLLINAVEAGSTSELAPLTPRMNLHECLTAMVSGRSINSLSAPELLQLLGLAQRWQTLETALATSREKATTLSLGRYFGDYAL